MASELGTLAQQYAELIERKKRCVTDEKDIASQLAEIEEKLLDQMADAGIQSLNTESGLNLYRKTEKFYGPSDGVSKDDLIAELARHPETMDLVSPTYNSNSLRSRLREIEENGELLPEDLQKKIRITERFRVGYRSS